MVWAVTTGAQRATAAAAEAWRTLLSIFRVIATPRRAVWTGRMQCSHVIRIISSDPLKTAQKKMSWWVTDVDKPTMS